MAGTKIHSGNRYPQHLYKTWHQIKKKQNKQKTKNKAAGQQLISSTFEQFKPFISIALNFDGYRRTKIYFSN